MKGWEGALHREPNQILSMFVLRKDSDVEAESVKMVPGRGTGCENGMCPAALLRCLSPRCTKSQVDGGIMRDMTSVDHVQRGKSMQTSY